MNFTFNLTPAQKEIVLDSAFYIKMNKNYTATVRNLESFIWGINQCGVDETFGQIEKTTDENEEFTTLLSEIIEAVQNPTIESEEVVEEVVEEVHVNDMTMGEINDEIREELYNLKKKNELLNTRGYFGNTMLLLIDENGDRNELYDNTMNGTAIICSGNTLKKKDINKIHSFCKENNIENYSISMVCNWYEWNADYQEYEPWEIDYDKTLYIS